jgi:retron-type reverse transcriptase
MQEKAEPFHPFQHAFRKGHCTENALSRIVDTAEKDILCKQVAIAVFLDIKGAFDNLSSKAIEDGLKGHKVENDLTEWFCSYLNSRYCRVKGSKQYVKLVKGTGQGGVLSPTVWNYVMDSFLTTFSNHKVDTYSYADNGALIVVSCDIVTARRHMHKYGLLDWD